MTMNRRLLLETVSTAVVTLAAIVMVGFYMYDRSGSTTGHPRRVEDWEDWRTSALTLGPPETPVVVSVFTDFTCPFCRALAPVLDSLRREFPQSVAIDVMHFPLEGHPMAIPAATAAECAHEQGAFPSMFDILFTKMDSTGVKPWSEFATEAGVANVPAFEACITRDSETFPRIAAGRRHGAEAGVRGTPTVWMNGQMFDYRTFDALKERAEALGAR